MDERLAYMFEANRRRSKRFQRMLIVVSIVLVAVVCMAIALAVLVIHLQLESAHRSNREQQINDESEVGDEKSDRIVFAINVVSRKHNRVKRAFDNTKRLASSIIRSMIAMRRSDGTEFALEQYSVPGSTTFTSFWDAHEALKLLSTAMDLDLPFNNPNQTDAILRYQQEYGDSSSQQYNYIYILFAADPSTYRNAVVYEEDMKDSGNILDKVSRSNSHTVVVGDVHALKTHTPVISDIGAIDQVISRINAHLSDSPPGRTVTKFSPPRTQSERVPNDVLSGSSENPENNNQEQPFEMKEEETDNANFEEHTVISEASSKAPNDSESHEIVEKLKSLTESSLDPDQSVDVHRTLPSDEVEVVSQPTELYYGQTNSPRYGSSVHITIVTPPPGTSTTESPQLGGIPREQTGFMTNDDVTPSGDDQSINHQSIGFSTFDDGSQRSNTAVSSPADSVREQDNSLSRHQHIAVTSHQEELNNENGSFSEVTADESARSTMSEAETDTDAEVESIHTDITSGSPSDEGDSGVSTAIDATADASENAAEAARASEHYPPNVQTSTSDQADRNSGSSSRSNYDRGNTLRPPPPRVHMREQSNKSKPSGASALEILRASYSTHGLTQQETQLSSVHNFGSAHYAYSSTETQKPEHRTSKILGKVHPIHLAALQPLPPNVVRGPELSSSSSATDHYTTDRITQIDQIEMTSRPETQQTEEIGKMRPETLFTNNQQGAEGVGTEEYQQFLFSSTQTSPSSQETASVATSPVYVVSSSSDAGVYVYPDITEPLDEIESSGETPFTVSADQNVNTAETFASSTSGGVTGIPETEPEPDFSSRSIGMTGRSTSTPRLQTKFIDLVEGGGSSGEIRHLNTDSKLELTTSPTSPEGTVGGAQGIPLKDRASGDNKLVVTTPHIFDASMSTVSTTEITEQNQSPTFPTSQTNEYIRHQNSRMDNTTAFDMSDHNARTSPSSTDSKDSASESYDTDRKESAGIAGAEKITFVNISPASDEVIEAQQTDSDDIISSFEDRRSLVESASRANVVWPSGKTTLETRTPKEQRSKENDDEVEPNSGAVSQTSPSTETTSLAKDSSPMRSPALYNREIYTQSPSVDNSEAALESTEKAFGMGHIEDEPTSITFHSQRTNDPDFQLTSGSTNVRETNTFSQDSTSHSSVPVETLIISEPVQTASSNDMFRMRDGQRRSPANPFASTISTEQSSTQRRIPSIPTTIPLPTDQNEMRTRTSVTDFQMNQGYQILASRPNDGSGGQIAFEHTTSGQVDTADREQTSSSMTSKYSSIRGGASPTDNEGESTLSAGHQQRSSSQDPDTQLGDAATGDSSTIKHNSEIDHNGQYASVDSVNSPHDNSKGSVYPCVVDLIVAIDYEPTVTVGRSKLMKALERIVNRLTISEEAIRVAIASYGLDDGVGIYADAFADSKPDVVKQLQDSLDYGGDGFGTVYSLTSLVQSLRMYYTLQGGSKSSNEDSRRRNIRPNANVVFLVFSDSRNATDVKAVASSGFCSESLDRCRVLAVGLENAVNLSRLTNSTSLTMSMPDFTTDSLNQLKSFVDRNICS